MVAKAYYPSVQDPEGEAQGVVALAAEFGKLAESPAAAFDHDGLPPDHPEFGVSGQAAVRKVGSKCPRFIAWKKEFREQLRVGDAGTDIQLKEDVLKLLFAYNDVFAENPGAPNPISGVEHVINLVVGQAVVPRKERLRRCSPKELQAMYDETEKMLRNGIIQPSTSPWAANVIMVPKPSDPLGGLRYCTDYRTLNRFTIGDSMILPRVDDLLDSLADVEVFSMMDAAAGFWGVKVKEEHRHLTAFNTWTHGQMEFVRMPFGLKNAPPTFQRAMQNILHPYVCDVVNPALYMLKAAKARVDGTPPSDGFITSRDVPEGYVADAARDKALSGKRIASLYIDDICVHGKVAEHTDSLAKILKRLRGNNVSLKMVKCEFVVTTGKFLGHVVKAGEGTVADPKKVQGIVAMKRPTTVAHLRTLLPGRQQLP